MYKLLVIDLDGTLLNDEKNIPDENIRAIEKLYYELGIIPVIATARPLDVARYIAQKGGPAFQGYIIATNGAILYDLKREKYIINESLSREQISSIIKVCDENKLEFEFMTTSGEVADKQYEYRRVVDPMYDNMGVPFNFQDDIKQYALKTEESIPLVAVNGSKGELERCYKCIASIPGLEISGMCERTTPQKDPTGNLIELAYYDIMKSGATKGNAIRMLSKMLGITKEQIIAIGDGANDIPLFNEAGFSIAMRNGGTEIKNAAKVVTPKDNNSGGLGDILSLLFDVLIKRKKDPYGLEKIKSNQKGIGGVER